MSTDNCALDASGNLKKTSEIEFFGSPSDKTPLPAAQSPPGSPTSLPTKNARSLRLIFNNPEADKGGISEPVRSEVANSGTTRQSVFKGANAKASGAAVKDSDNLEKDKKKKDKKKEEREAQRKRLQKLQGNKSQKKSKTAKEPSKTKTPRAPAKKKRARDTDPSSSDETDTGKSRKRHKGPRKPKTRTYILVETDDEVTSGSESDGHGAIRALEAAEALKEGRTGARGPLNLTMRHWFEPKPVLCPKSGPRWSFQCKYCEKDRTFARTRNVSEWAKEEKRPGLSNLASHTREAHKSEMEAAEKETNSSIPVTSEKPIGHSEGTYSLASAKLMEGYLKERFLNPRIMPTQKGFKRMFAAWLIEDDLAWTTGESPGLVRLFQYMKSHFMLPSDTTVRNEVAALCIEMHAKVVKELATVKSKISYSTDTWTTKQMVFTFCGVMGSFIDDEWNLIERLIDFRHLESHEHKGANAAKAFVDSARKMGRLDMITITMDNASSNDTLARMLATLLLKYDVTFDPKNGQIRCLPHVINLVVQKILSVLSIDHEDDEVADPDIEDYYPPNKHLPMHYDPSKDEDLLAMEAEFDLDDDDDHVDTETDASDSDDEMEVDEKGKSKKPKTKGPIGRLRYISTKIVSSPQRRALFRKLARQHYENKSEARLMPIRDVKTRWNWTHAMIERGMVLRKAIDAWAQLTPECRKHSLSKSDWKILEAIGKVLKPFTQITETMSQANTPTLCFALPFFYRMEAHLAEVASGPAAKTIPGLYAAVQAGGEKLQKYYKKAKANRYNIIATACHPDFRLDWFQKIGYAFYLEARAIVKDVYDEYSKKQSSRGNADHAPGPTVQHSQYDQLALALGSPVRNPLSEEKTEDLEWTRWCKGEGGGSLRGPLSWWKEHHHQFPVMAAIARDFLAILGSAVSVERLFSSSRHLCSDVRSSLKAGTITEAMRTKHWLRNGLL